MNPNDDPLIQQLRREASRLDPKLPEGLHRKVMSALARVDEPADSRAQRPGTLYATWRWIIVGVCTAAFVAGALGLFQQRPNPAPIAKHPSQNPAPSVAIFRSTQSTGLPTPTPVSLAMLLVDDPMETELQKLMTDFTTARDTITRALPGPRKSRPQPATEPRSSLTAPAGA